LLGAFTGIAAFFGSFLNMNFLLAGTVSTNPMLFALSTFLVLSWKVCGYYGFDRYLLPKLGVPWKTHYEATAPAQVPVTARS
jgi:thiosulfate dehydrogenase [quinone] large subunit